MDDFRLKVFIAAAKTLSFTRCAEQLYISQPAVSKHVGELEARYKVQLFERRGSRLALTEAGAAMLRHAERIADDYRRLRYEMDLFADRLGGELRIGASTTIAQYVLPRMLARFTSRFPEVRVSLISGNSGQVEEALVRHDADLGLVESATRRPGFHYEPFMPDELVLVASSRGRYGRCERITLDELQQAPLVLRENGSGTLEVVARYLAAAGIRISSLRVIMRLGSTESIKAFVRSSDALAIVSVASVVDELRSGELRIVDMEGCAIRRDFSFVWPEGRGDALASRFVGFVRSFE
ncbi:MAG: LysR family transcriptional regulator [Alistipes sp.]|nr:LysR family transcriptional regulator [Alistipes sp.]